MRQTDRAQRAAFVHGARPTIALDTAGGDHAPQETIAGALRAIESLGVNVLLVGDEEQVRSELSKAGATLGDRLTLLHAPETISMDEHAGSAVRRRRRTSMQVVADAVRDASAHAGVSAGNSGAFFATSLLTLGRLPGIDRPAIATVFPTQSGVCLVLDVGANADAKPKQLVDFAVLGSIYVEQLFGREAPRVGLLSNGEEATKGPIVVQAAHELLLHSGLRFIGNVEGKDVPRGVADVVVCDGFAGNVLIKTAEGVAETIVGLLRDELTRNPVRKLQAALLQPAFRAIRSRLDYSEYGGAVLLGLRGVMVVAHGRSNARAIMNAIRVARDAVDRDLVPKMEAGLVARTSREESRPGS